MTDKGFAKKMVKKITERLAYKLTSSRNIIGVGLVVLLTVLFLKQNLNERNYIDGLRWVSTAFFLQKAVEHHSKNKYKTPTKEGGIE